MLLKVIQISIIAGLTSQNGVLADVVKKLPPLEPGIMIEVRGDAWHYNSHTFWIDFREGTDEPDGDIGFHMSVRFRTGKLVFNTWSKENGWGEEETHTNIPQGWDLFRHDYEEVIIVRDDHFQVFLNEKEYKFKFRTPIENLKFVVVGGHYEVNWIKFDKEFIFDGE